MLTILLEVRVDGGFSSPIKYREVRFDETKFFSFEQFRDQVKIATGFPCFSLVYTDEEGDLVTLDNDDDLKEAVEVAQGMNGSLLVAVQITLRQMQQSFEDNPQSQSLVKNSQQPAPSSSLTSINTPFTQAGPDAPKDLTSAEEPLSAHTVTETSAIQRASLKQSAAESSMTAGSSTGASWVEHVINEGQFHRLILQTRLQHEWALLPSATALAQHVLEGLRAAGSFTEAQLSLLHEQLMAVLLQAPASSAAPAPAGDTSSAAVSETAVSKEQYQEPSVFGVFELETVSSDPKRATATASISRIPSTSSPRLLVAELSAAAPIVSGSSSSGLVESPISIENIAMNSEPSMLGSSNQSEQDEDEDIFEDAHTAHLTEAEDKPEAAVVIGAMSAPVAVSRGAETVPVVNGRARSLVGLSTSALVDSDSDGSDSDEGEDDYLIVDKNMEYVLPADLASSMHSSMHRGGDCDDNSLTAESSSAESHTDDEDSPSDLDSEFVPAEARSLGWQEAFVAPLTRSVQFDLAEELVRPHAAGDQMTASFEQLERERLAGFEQHREHDLKLSRWSKELLLLADMGLVDVERNIALLEDSPNGVESVIDTLCQLNCCP